MTQLTQSSAISSKSKASARSCIEKYFSFKGIFDEGLLDDKYIELCFATDISSAVDRAYAAIEKSGRFKEDSAFCPIEKDVKFVIGILGDMSRIIPQEYSAGILLMHLEFIEKIPA